MPFLCVRFFFFVKWKASKIQDPSCFCLGVVVGVLFIYLNLKCSVLILKFSHMLHIYNEKLKRVTILFSFTVEGSNFYCLRSFFFLVKRKAPGCCIHLFFFFVLLLLFFFYKFYLWPFLCLVLKFGHLLHIHKKSK